MIPFVVGQRWASNTESSLGLGIVIEVEGRHVTLSFPAAETVRTYAADGSALQRIRYSVGDEVADRNQRHYRIVEITEADGLIEYQCVDEAGAVQAVHEIELDAFVQFATPPQRLVNAQLDKPRAFELKVDTLAHLERLAASPVAGLLGSRTALLPHQVYIGAEVAGRHAPRVLLADEVGLGKTIEAGMILHHQLLTGRAQRILIVVPETLVHQWLVEMLRRFNLAFAIFDGERVAALREDGFSNAFEAEQLVIINLDECMDDEGLVQDAVAAEWDLVVVDEAHHLHWSETDASAEYRFIEQLAQRSAGLLLLTGTPEQVGMDAHFARLRLVDPVRFASLEAFRDEQAGYEALNDVLESLLSADGPVDPGLATRIGEQIGELPEPPPDRSTLARQLLDRYGTGRVLYRNTRAAVAGFPDRLLLPAPLPAPAGAPAGSLFPESGQAAEQWLADDPRVAWLAALLGELRPEKVLVICHFADTAIALERHLRLREGVRCAAFHEGMTIIERDRAAAYFAGGAVDDESGADALVCSEIGSEGRNFQFAQHLVLFDLPFNPDLLEQRIGRLDRIGQRETVQIHVPYLAGSAQEILFRWYHEGLDTFTASCPAAYAVFERFHAELESALAMPAGDHAALLDATRAFTSDANAALAAGRDRLLELNSCDPERAGELIAGIEEEEASGGLRSYMEEVFNQHGVNVDMHSAGCLIVQASDQMLTDHFPGLADDALTVTFDRARALAREDMSFLSWEHPMVTEAMAMIRDSDFGSATVIAITTKSLPAGTLLLEAYFTVATVAEPGLRLGRFLPPAVARALVDERGRDLAAKLDHDRLNAIYEPLPHEVARSVVTAVRGKLDAMIDGAQLAADGALPALRGTAHAAAARLLDAEIERMVAQREVNPAIRDDEIDYLRHEKEAALAAIERASMQMQALRLIVSR